MVANIKSLFIVYILYLHQTCTCIFMPLFDEEGAYCFANVGRLIGRSVRPSVNQIVSDHHLKSYLLQGFHISHADWSW